MENPRGRVLAVYLDKPVPSAEVEVASAFSCARCKAGKGCGAGLLGDNRKSRRIDAQVATGVTVQEGDEVRIELAPRHLLNAALIVYGVPLVGAMSGAALAYIAGLTDLFAAIAGLAGLGAGVAVARRRLRATQGLCEFAPTIVERLGH